MKKWDPADTGFIAIAYYDSGRTMFVGYDQCGCSIIRGPYSELVFRQMIQPFPVYENTSMVEVEEL